MERRDLEDQRFQASDDVEVALPSRVAIGKLVLLPGMEFLRIADLNLVVGQAIAHSTLDLTQGSPFHQRAGG
jgi:hypothetical protein